MSEMRGPLTPNARTLHRRNKLEIYPPLVRLRIRFRTYITCIGFQYQKSPQVASFVIVCKSRKLSSLWPFTSLIIDIHAGITEPANSPRRL